MTSELEQGWDFISKNQGSNISAQMGSEYIQNVDTSIREFEELINSRTGTSMGVGQLKGFMAEYWHAGTFNIDAALKNSKSHAYVNGSNAHASVDVSTNFGKDYSMKYYATGKDSAINQAKNVIQSYYEYLAKSKTENPLSFDEYLAKYSYSSDMNVLLKSIYYGQGRIIPSDQLQDAIKYLEQQIAKESVKQGSNRALVLADYKETLQKLADRIRDNNGIESTPLTKKEAETIAALCKNGEFKAADFGFNLNELVTNEYIIQQALTAGITSAIITLVLQLGPEIYKVIDYLIKNGEIDEEQLKTLGFKIISSGAEGFLRGAISASLTIACQAGKLGAQFINIHPSVIGSLTVIVLDTMKNSYQVVCGKMTVQRMNYNLTKAITLSGIGLAGGIVGQFLLPELPVLGYMLGSFVGSVVGSFTVNAGEQALLSFCADTGYCFFGLVEQDYELPKEIFERMGIALVDYKQIDYKRIQYCKTTYKQISYQKVKYQTIDVMWIKRGVISVNKIGYVL